MSNRFQQAYQTPRMVYSDRGSRFWSEICAFERWHSGRAGTYKVSMLSGVWEYLFLADASAPNHLICVVDYFGSLVKVPA